MINAQWFFHHARLLMILGIALIPCSTWAFTSCDPVTAGIAQNVTLFLFGPCVGGHYDLTTLNLPPEVPKFAAIRIAAANLAVDGNFHWAQKLACFQCACN